MSEMVKRVARLLCRLDAFRNNGKIGNRNEMDHHVEHLWPVFEADARSVIKAMREESEAAALAGANEAQIRIADAKICWRAMIDQALEQPGERGAV